jgi:hypothetical protein
MWLIAATGMLALTILALAVAETNLRAHYLIDQGEYISMFGLAFILVAGLYLYSRARLFASLWLIFPWLLYPVVTQGDQIIDHLDQPDARDLSSCWQPSLPRRLRDRHAGALYARAEAGRPAIGAAGPRCFRIAAALRRRVRRRRPLLAWRCS